MNFVRGVVYAAHPDAVAYTEDNYLQMFGVASAVADHANWIVRHSLMDDFRWELGRHRCVAVGKRNECQPDAIRSSSLSHLRDG